MKTKREAIQAFLAAGYPLIPLRGKKPYEENWEHTTVGQHSEEELVGNGNYGVVLDAEDLVIDVDIRNYAPGDKPLERLGQAIGGIPTGTLVTRTGAGGLHIFLKKPADVAARNGLPAYPGIEFKAGPGRQVVGPGSIHPDTTQEYRHLQGRPDAIADAPQALLDLVKRVPVVFAGAEGTCEYKDDDATRQRATHWLEKTAAPAIQGFGGDTQTFKAAAQLRDFGLSPRAAYDLLLLCYNPRCAPSWDEDDLAAKVQHAYTYARGAVGSKHPAAVFDKVEMVAQEKAALTAEAQAVDDSVSKMGWKMAGPKGKEEIARCFQNLLNYFSVPSAKLRGIFGYNEFSRRVELIAKAPWGAVAGLPVTDIDLQRLRAHLARNHGYDAGKDDLVDAMVDTSQRRRFHPVREFLGALKWDGTPRLDTWLSKYLGVRTTGEHKEEAGYVAAVGRKTLIAAVARVYDPGCKFDHVLVLEGRQNLGKSGVCKVLGGEWYSDFKMNAGEKDTIQMMQGKWIVEMPELHATRASDVDTLKAFLTRTIDEARFAYGRLPGRYPRQGIFIGTYNPGPDGTYLKDDENRRWWPVMCHPVAGRRFDFAGLKAVRDQLWAEAVALYRKGEALTMDTPELEDAATAVQAARKAEHPWKERVAAWIAEQDKNIETRQDFLTGREVFVGAMAGLDARYSRHEQLEVARALKSLKWEPAFKRRNGILLSGFKRRSVEPAMATASVFGDLGE